jgi:O-antigen ligase
MLAGFFVTLRLARIPADRVAAWFIISLVPHAVLGAVQFLNQDAFGSSLLGMAVHHPWDQGVSVVQHGLYRVLRAYGGFPHPNILGGWLAVGLALLPGLAIRAKGKLGMIAYIFASALFATALVFTFSRGAWIAATVGFLSAIVLAWKRSGSVLCKQAVVLIGVITLCVAGMWVFVQFDHVSARFTPQYQLEAWSLETRARALSDGVAAWELRPVTGWGPGASLIGVSDVRKTDERWSLIAPEPPHLVPLVILTETGILGALAILALVVLLIQSLVANKRWDALPLLLAGSAIAATDHYLWTLWSGMALFAFGVFEILQFNTPGRHCCNGRVDDGEGRE